MYSKQKRRENTGNTAQVEPEVFLISEKPSFLANLNAPEKNMSNITNEIIDRPQNATQSSEAVVVQKTRPTAPGFTLDQAVLNGNNETDEIADERSPGSETSRASNLAVNSIQLDLKPENLHFLEDTPLHSLDFWYHQDRKDDCWSVFSSKLDECL